MDTMNRRTMMGSVVAGAAASTMLGGASAQGAEEKTLKKYPNEHFYKADGTFDQEAARAAFYEMFAFYNYPIVPKLKTEEFWVADFGLGNFAEVGMGGIFWVNRKEDDYFGHEIYLLPGQMIPEHAHVKTEEARPKMEAWQVRHGSCWTYGEGTPNAADEARIPPMHKEIAKARCAVELHPGEVNALAGAEQWHFMLAGDSGAIVTEYASYHDGNALRFTHEKIKF